MDIAEQLQQKIVDAALNGQTLAITGNNTRAFYGREIDKKSSPLYVAEHSGIIDYQPSELTITARAGTPLTVIIERLAEHGQMLPFEPPTFADKASLGGCIATALAGPRRPWTGSVRDYVLGMRVLTGDAKDIRVGGKVMKNVAGYDLFRPMAGALGTLGVMLDISLKLLPIPQREMSFSMAANTAKMQTLLLDWQRSSLPLSAASYSDGCFNIRLSGSSAAVDASIHSLPSAMQETSSDYWQKLNEQQLPFFDDPVPLYRLLLPANTAGNTLQGESLLDWGGSLRWLKTSATFSEVQKQASALGGSALVYRNGNRNDDVFAPLDNALFALHKRIKKVMDPASILNPGRLYRGL